MLASHLQILLYCPPICRCFLAILHASAPMTEARTVALQQSALWHSNICQVWQLSSLAEAHAKLYLYLLWSGPVSHRLQPGFPVIFQVCSVVLLILKIILLHEDIHCLVSVSGADNFTDVAAMHRQIRPLPVARICTWLHLVTHRAFVQ